MQTADRLRGGKIYVKPVNYLCGLLCIACGAIAAFGAYRYNIYTHLAPFYIAFFGVMMIASDRNITFIIERCTFLDVYIGRGLFNVFVGSQVVDQASYASNDANTLPLGDVFHIFGEIVGYAIMVLGLYLIVLHFLESNSSINGNTKETLRGSS